MSIGLNDLCGLRCRIFGLGRSNEALISFLHKKGAEIYVSDKRKSEKDIIDVLQRSGIKNAEIIPYFESRAFDYVFRTPSIRADAPEITADLSKGAKLSSEVELFFDISKGSIYGITGSDGKTTTTTLVYMLLKESIGSAKAFIGGNIGTPLISFADELSDDSVTVCELSSFQLMTLKKSPKRAAITNITENHLDYHTTIDEYIASKCRIFEKGAETLVTDRKTLEVFNKYSSNLPDKIILTALDDKDADIFTSENAVYVNGDKVLDLSLYRVPGRYNVSNLMTAIGLALPYADRNSIRSVAENFVGVEHRNEYVREVRGVKYFNCSIDSTPSRTLATLSTHTESSVTLILGGYDKGLDYSELARNSAGFVKNYILMGENRSKIMEALIAFCDRRRIYQAKDIHEAVMIAASVTNSGERVILSPASASFDMFDNFEERGIIYKYIVNSL